MRIVSYDLFNLEGSCILRSDYLFFIFFNFKWRGWGVSMGKLTVLTFGAETLGEETFAFGFLWLVMLEWTSSWEIRLHSKTGLWDILSSCIFPCSILSNLIFPIFISSSFSILSKEFDILNFLHILQLTVLNLFFSLNPLLPTMLS